MGFDTGNLHRPTFLNEAKRGVPSSASADAALAAPSRSGDTLPRGGGGSRSGSSPCLNHQGTAM